MDQVSAPTSLALAGFRASGYRVQGCLLSLCCAFDVSCIHTDSCIRILNFAPQILLMSSSHECNTGNWVSYQQLPFLILTAIFTLKPIEAQLFTEFQHGELGRARTANVTPVSASLLVGNRWVVVKIMVMVPFWGTLNYRCRTIIGTQKGTIVLTATHVLTRT